MTKRDADGNVALYCHASQIQRGVFSGKKSKQDEHTTDRDIYLEEDVAADKQYDGQCHLDHIVKYQMEKQDVAWIHVKDLKNGKKITQKKSKSN